MTKSQPTSTRDYGQEKGSRRAGPWNWFLNYQYFLEWVGHSWQGLLNWIHGIGISLACIYLYQESSLSIYHLKTSIIVGRSGKRIRIISVAGSRRSCTRSITSSLRLFIVIPISIVPRSIITHIFASGWIQGKVTTTWLNVFWCSHYR